MGHRFNPTVEFTLAKDAGAYGLDLGSAGFAYIAGGGFTVDGVKTERLAVVTQHYDFYHMPGEPKAADHLTKAWRVEFMEDGDPQEIAVLHSLDDALRVAKDFCAGDML